MLKAIDFRYLSSDAFVDLVWRLANHQKVESAQSSVVEDELKTFRDSRGSGVRPLLHLVDCQNLFSGKDCRHFKNPTAEKLKGCRSICREHYARVIDNGETGSNGSVEMAKELSAKEGIPMLFQYGNPANPRAHYEGTAAEIIRDCPEIDVFVAGLGTGGTLMGCAKRFKEHRADIQIVACEPLQGDPVSGLRSLDDGFIPPILDITQLDRKLLVENMDAIIMTRRLASEQGIFAGVSSGAVMHTCARVASTMERGTIVGIICDSGWKYLSAGIWTGDLDVVEETLDNGVFW